MTERKEWSLWCRRRSCQVLMTITIESPWHQDRKPSCCPFCGQKVPAEPCRTHAWPDKTTCPVCLEASAKGAGANGGDR